MKVDEIRERFLAFFEKHGHKIYQSDSLVPRNDPTLLFTSAGMNQFKEEFLGRVRGPGRAATCQKCLRTGDLEKVGHTPNHHTFFEMLGNFSFGDYFKKEAIIWAWEFLTKELGLEGQGLWVSVYKDDDEAYDIWRDVIKVPSKKILKLGERENFWPANAPAQGPNGPCGPCSEIFYGGPEGVEVWNLVFTQYDRKESGALEPLPSKNIDTGMGLERIARVMQKKGTNFEIDSFQPIVNTIRELSDKKSLLSPVQEARINAIADHIRAVTFAIADGVHPSNEERGYVIRKLIRRAFWYGTNIGLDGPFLYKIVPSVAKVMKRPYPELTERREDIAQVVLAEEDRFTNTIQEGLNRLDKMISDSRPKGILSGRLIFKLYDTYGFPLELTQEIAASENIALDLDGFEKCMKEQRAKSRDKSKIESSIFTAAQEVRIRLPQKTPFIEDKENIEARIVLVIRPTDSRKKQDFYVFLNKTNFYGEKGGQVGDTGVLLKDNKIVAQVINAVDVAGRTQHEIKSINYIPKKGDTITARVDLRRRESIKKNHTATHLLHYALRRVLGAHVRQAGSLVAPEHLRFDFTHFKALTEEELNRVEEIVNNVIKENSKVYVNEDISLEDAKRQGAIALFGEKYDDRVRMVSVSDYSKELCGGTHVETTGVIGRFKIVSESSIASGVRRIEALTGEAAEEELKKSENLIKDIAQELHTTPENILQKIRQLNSRLKEIEKEIEDSSSKLVQLCTEELLNNIKKIKHHDVVIGEVKNCDISLLRKIADNIKEKIKAGMFILVSEKDKKISMLVGLSSCFRDKGINAGDVLKEIGSDFGIRGGGRQDFAQAGGRLEGFKIRDILKKAEEVIKKEAYL